MGSNKRYAAYYDRRTEERIIESFVIKHGPLQSLTAEEVELDRLPLTIYPEGHRPRVKAWVRFGPKHTTVEALLVRSNGLAAGIEFVVRDKVYRCWVWGNAVTPVEPE